MDVCIWCFAQFPHEPTPYCDDAKSTPTGIDMSKPDIVDMEAIESRGVGRPPKEGHEMNDVEAAGRKRSVRAKPIRTGDICEWALLKQAGGGVIPIEGCPGNPARHVHHGPDKSVLNNDIENNLSAVCTHCHNRWHTLNDPYYRTPRPANGGAWLPDDELADGMQYFELNNDGPKMTKIEALQIEILRNQDDARGRFK